MQRPASLLMVVVSVWIMIAVVVVAVIRFNSIHEIQQARIEQLEGSLEQVSNRLEERLVWVYEEFNQSNVQQTGLAVAQRDGFGNVDEDFKAVGDSLSQVEEHLNSLSTILSDLIVIVRLIRDTEQDDTSIAAQRQANLVNLRLRELYRQRLQDKPTPTITARVGF